MTTTRAFDPQSNVRRRVNLQRLILHNGGPANVAAKLAVTLPELSLILAGKQELCATFVQRVESTYGLPAGALDDGYGVPTMPCAPSDADGGGQEPSHLAHVIGQKARFRQAIQALLDTFGGDDGLQPETLATLLAQQAMETLDSVGLLPTPLRAAQEHLTTAVVCLAKGRVIPMPGYAALRATYNLRGPTHLADPVLTDSPPCF